MSAHGEILVLGNGVAGLCAATALAQRGRRVHLYAPRPRPDASCCSWWAGGMLAPWCEAVSAPPSVLPMGLASLGFWKTVFPDVQTKGTLVVAPAAYQPLLDQFGRRTSHFTPLDAAGVASLEPVLEGRFSSGLFFAEEAHLDPRAALLALSDALPTLGARVTWGDTFPDPSAFQTIVDCRGLAARDMLPDLRGVRGEMLTVCCPDVVLSRPVRLLHPRIPLYIVPRDTHVFMIGATMIESETRGGVTVQSMLELLSAAVTLHPAFGQAQILDTGADVRPAFPDNVPALRQQGGRFFLNGLYRHGFLAAPALAMQLADSLS